WSSDVCSSDLGPSDARSSHARSIVSCMISGSGGVLHDPAGRFDAVGRGVDEGDANEAGARVLALPVAGEEAAGQDADIILAKQAQPEPDAGPPGDAGPQGDTGR